MSLIPWEYELAWNESVFKWVGVLRKVRHWYNALKPVNNNPQWKYKKESKWGCQRKMPVRSETLHSVSQTMKYCHCQLRIFLYIYYVVLLTFWLNVWKFSGKYVNFSQFHGDVSFFSLSLVCQYIYDDLSPNWQEKWSCLFNKTEILPCWTEQLLLL